jgi:hypothetical protein
MPQRVVAAAGAFSKRFSCGRPGRALGSGFGGYLLTSNTLVDSHGSLILFAPLFALRAFAASMNTSARKYGWRAHRLQIF